MAVRTAQQRKAHALDRLEHETDVWVATASSGGSPHLVPLSLGWDGHDVVVATPAHARTARNAADAQAARLAVGDSRDVVVIDAVVAVVPLLDARAADVQRLVDRIGWDPRQEPGEWVLLFMRPSRVQVWRDLAEIAGRTVMRDGEWVE